MPLPTLPLERYAELRAEMAAGTPRDAVLRKEGLNAEAWLHAERTWLGKMGREAKRGRFALMNRYVAATRAHRPELLDGAQGNGPGRAPLTAGLRSPPPTLMRHTSYAAALSIFAQEFERTFSQPDARWTAQVQRAAELVRQHPPQERFDESARERLYHRYCTYWRARAMRSSPVPFAVGVTKRERLG